MAKIKLRRLKAKVIGVTGSVGKTSTKEAILAVLNPHFKVRASEGSYNTDFGLALAILRLRSGFSNPLKWLWILVKAIFEAFLSNEQLDYLILEMGVDKPGDMDILLKVVKIDVAVVLNVKMIHLEEDQFADLEEIALEKRKLGQYAKKLVIVNHDDPFLHDIKTEAKKFTFGLHPKSDLRAMTFSPTPQGVKASFKYNKKEYEAQFSLLGKHQLYVLMPAISVGLYAGVSFQKISEALAEFELPRGRMNIIPGMNGATIIDSSYNASPEAVAAALEILTEFPASRKIAVLGNMNELGKYSEKAHEEIGEQVAKVADLLVTVGENGKIIAHSAAHKGLKEIYSFMDAIEAGRHMRDMIEKGDVILVKGSQNKVRLERFVKEIMKEPEMAGTLLVRQSAEWQSKA